MFEELQRVRWHPDSDTDAQLQEIVEAHPDLSNLDTPGKRVAYVIKKSRKERFFVYLHTNRNSYNRKIRRMYVRMVNSRDNKRRRRQSWASHMSSRAGLFQTSSVYIRLESYAQSDFFKIILGTCGNWIGGGRLWIWQSSDGSSPFRNIYHRVNYLLHIDHLIQYEMQGRRDSSFTVLDSLLVSYRALQVSSTHSS